MNREVNLTKRVQTPHGWRYCTVVLSTNGRVKPDLVIVNGKQECHKEGAYYLAGCGKTRFEADAVPRNSLVSTAQPDKKKVCVEKTRSSWMCLAT